MKKYMVPVISMFLFLTLGQLSKAQTAFHKYSLSVSATEGSNQAIYATKGLGSDVSAPGRRAHVDGCVDPLILEFGISDKFGIGFTAGSDFYKIDANKFYNYNPVYQTGKLVSYAHYFTFDLNYHPYVSKKLDLSFSLGAGTLKVNVFDSPVDNTTMQNAPADDGSNQNAISREPYNAYMARGPLVRTGAKLRYYFWKRLGAMAMLTAFSGVANPQNSGDASFGNQYSTSIKGLSTEFGICFRFF